MRAPQDEIAVIVSLSDKLDRRLFKLADRSKRNTRLVRALKEKAAATQGTHRVFLQNKGARRLRELWAINGIAVTARASVIRQLASRPGIESIRLDSTLQAPVTTFGSAAPPEWNLNVMRAPELWSLGHSGAGVVVANMDTGVDAMHPDLAAQWRGGDNSWYDPHGEHVTPYDSDGHGTQTMAIMVGGAAGGTAIGMAPDARWIAVKLYNDAGAGKLQRHSSCVSMAARSRWRFEYGGCAGCGECLVGPGRHGGAVHYRVQRGHRGAQECRHCRGICRGQ